MTNCRLTGHSLSRFAGSLLASLAAIVGLHSCIAVNEELGQSYLATNQQYDIYTTSFPIEDIRMEQPDSLSAYSLYKFTIGAIRDEEFGLTTRDAAFTLVPINDTLDFGKAGTQQFKSFHFAALSDSISCATPDQQYILQNINVYELENAIDYTEACPEVKHSSKRITDGIPIYSGRDSLSFNFSKEFGEKYMSVTQAELDTLPEYVKRFPGIYITTDTPTGNSGRINMFKVPLDVSYNSSYGSLINGSYAELKFSAEYEGRGRVDTSFIYYIGPVTKYSLGGVTSTSVSEYPQLAYNISTNESSHLAGKATDVIYFEGGRTGLKPVIKANSLREKILAEISQHTDDPSKVIVNKATITLPFDFPDDYKMMYLFPEILSPTCRIATDTSITYAAVTDASIDSEDQGDVNRSLCNYAPDITHHAQEMLILTDMKKIDNYDIWMLAIANETVSNTSSSTSSELSSYEQQLAMMQYYNSMYGYDGYGYGGYGYGYGGYGYGGYGSSYYSNNYYNMMYLSSMYSSMSNSTSSSTKSEQMMDYHRFYKGILHGPTSEGKVPTFSITYAVPKE